MNEDAALSFEPQRRFLLNIAYRMLGRISEAEDAVQEAYIRWHFADRSSVADPRAFLARTVTRLCLDYLKSAQVKRETYIGPWLPEPVIDDDPTSAMDGDLSVALLMALERLSPLERAAFLLHDVFDVGFSEIATMLEKNEAACRQLASRAREHVRDSRPRFPVSQKDGSRLANAFFEALHSGDVQALQNLLADDVEFYSDGGGIKPAAINPLFGADRVVKFFAGLAKRAALAMPEIVYRGSINNLPGLISVESDGTVQSTAFDIRDGKIVAIYVVRNPEKLAHLNIGQNAGQPEPPTQEPS